jgi:hypothetical protein
MPVAHVPSGAPTAVPHGPGTHLRQAMAPSARTLTVNRAWRLREAAGSQAVSYADESSLSLVFTCPIGNAHRACRLHEAAPALGNPSPCSGYLDLLSSETPLPLSPHHSISHLFIYRVCLHANTPLSLPFSFYSFLSLRLTF